MNYNIIKMRGRGSIGLKSIGQGKALSNIDLENKLDGKPGFAGVFAMDELPSQQQNGMTMIVNFEPSTMGGSHWVGVAVRPEGCYYYDPFGLKAPETLKRWMKQNGKHIFFNDSQQQDIDSHRCGEFSFYFVNEMIKGTNIYDILYNLTQDPSIRNERFMEKYWRNH